MSDSYVKVNERRHRKGKTYKEKIHINPSEEGSLHKEMGIKQGEKIGQSRLAGELKKAKKEHNVKLERKVLFAENMNKK